MQNLDKLLESITMKGERAKLDSQLEMIQRIPGAKLDEFSPLLFTLFNSYISLEFLVDEHESDEDVEEIIADPTQLSKFQRVNTRVQELLRKGLRSLCSASAQRNISELIRKK